MKMFNAKSLSSLLIILSFVLVGCSSTPKKGSGDTSESVVAETENPVELNGSSDDNTAGLLQTVFFAYDSSSLGEDSKAVLEQNAQWLKDNESVNIQVEGNCDERGGHQYNLALGEKRAAVVRDYLEALGVSSARVSVISYGKEKPISFGHDDAAWGRNRRANFSITAK